MAKPTTLDDLSKWLTDQPSKGLVMLQGPGPFNRDIFVDIPVFDDILRMATAARAVHHGSKKVKRGFTFVARQNGHSADKLAIQETIYRFIKKRGKKGATCDEVEAELELPHQTASARVYDLEKADRLIDSGERRKTRMGRNARVLVTDAIK